MKHLNRPFQLVKFSEIDWTVIDKSRTDQTKNENLYAICSRPEVADYDISGKYVDAFRSYACVNLWVAIFGSFRENRNQPFM